MIRRLALAVVCHLGAWLIDVWADLLDARDRARYRRRVGRVLRASPRRVEHLIRTAISPEDADDLAARARTIVDLHTTEDPR